MRASFRLFVAALVLLAGLQAAPVLAQAAAPVVAKSPVDAALDRARTTMVSDPEQGLKLAVDAEALARRMPVGRERTLAIGTARWLQSEAYLRTGDVTKARPIIVQTLTDIASVGDVKLKGDLLLSFGSLLMDDGKAAEALKRYQQAFGIFQKLGEKRSMALAYHYIASLYLAANDYGNAERYYGKAATFYDGDPSLSLSLHNSRGNVLIELEEYPRAQIEYEQALKIARQMGNPQLEARILGNIARNQVEAGHLDDAQATLARGFALTRDASALPIRRGMLATAARLAYTRGHFAEAERLIRECFAGLNLKETSGDLKTAHLYAYLIFRQTGNIMLALEHIEALRRLTDEANKVATTAGAALATAKFDFASKETEIATMRADQADRAAAAQRTLFLSIGSAALVLVIVLAVSLVWIRRSRNQVRDANIVLNETNTALEKALKAKTEFLATTSHEIRTPLNGILGMTQVMLSDVRLEAQLRDRVGIIHGAGMTMRSLVDDILDVAKMETGNLTVDEAPMDLSATMRDVTRMWEEQARAKGLAFNLHLDGAPHWIVSDVGRLRQIVFNLLSNAIKFTENGGVSVRVGTEGDRLKLAITDTGIGIPDAKRDEIFESFKQADSGTTRKFGGTGLGLTICRNLARALGGDIVVTGAEGHGSVFTVDLPLVVAEAPAVEVKADGGGTMLILDRNPIARSMLKTLFEPRVGTLRFLATPDEALAAIGEGDVTLLLVDEGTLKAAGDDVFGNLAALTGAAHEAGAKTAILWLKPDEAVMTSLTGANVGQVIEKPVAGPALIEKLLPGAEENSGGTGSATLVSRAA